MEKVVEFWLCFSYNIGNYKTGYSPIGWSSVCSGFENGHFSREANFQDGLV